jgi:type I restriction enzyme S subunit
VTHVRSTSLTKIDWLSGLSLPSDWSESKVKYVAPGMQAGEAITAESIEPAGTYPVYGGNGLRGYTEAKTHDGTRILIGRQGALCGNVHLVSGEFWASEHAIVARAADTVDPRWLAYVLRVMNLGQYSQTAAQPGIGTAQINALPVPVPPTSEQRAIADFLDRETARIDTLIEEQRRLIETLNARQRAVLDEVTADVGGEVVRLKRLFEPSSDANHPDEQVLSVYRDYGVIPKASRDDNFNRTPGNVARYLLVRPGDVVINRMKAWQGSLGVSEHRGIVSGDYEVVRPRTDRLLPRFAHLFLRSPRMVAEYAIRSTGIRPSQWRLYWDQMGMIEMPVPALPQQREVVDHIDGQSTKIDTLVVETERFIELSKERRAALIAAAVTGQIDLREMAW